ncbi:MAG: RNA-binding cell elongation regulator Jag/EloR [Armatimonadota bacterium]
MRNAEGIGKTLEDAKEDALQKLQAKPDDVTIDIVQEPGGVSAWFGGGNYRVVATLRESSTANTPETATLEDTDISNDIQDPQEEENRDTTPEAETAQEATEDDEHMQVVRQVAERAREITQDIVDLMGVEDTDVQLVGVDPDEVRVDVKGESLGLLIGHHGETIDALQLVVAIGANKPFDDGARVIVDAANYRERHKEMLREMAIEYATEARERGEEAVIPDLKAYERRIVHLELRDDPSVETYSEGEGDDRRLIISPIVDEDE